MVATAALVDLRRADLRSNTLANPYWITSGEINKDCTAKCGLLFSFPKTKSISPAYKPFFIDQVIVEVTTLFAGGTPSIDIGTCTLATDAVTTGGTGTIVIADDFMKSDDITETTAGIYPCGATGTDSAWLTMKILGDGLTPYYIVPVDTDVVAVYATVAVGLTAGAARVHMLIQEVP